MSSDDLQIIQSDAGLSAEALAKVETYRFIGKIVAELDVIEAEPKETDKAHRDILKQLAV